ncbi:MULTISPECIES: dienelactone hydrolase family protein [Streptomyces]|uniref:Dienelactone hydrolase n=1 Tax=Streptomyces viridochromogenes TaxID=1938 RepID=A0A0L8KPW8_STRVR|nr:MULTISPECIES: dienelactone hydrolase family protein [Streptomyces]KOG27967.1 dienelactone hydrolase [Streptomyces viridochromogenes]
MTDDGLTDFTRERFRHEGRSHTVLRSGKGPAVIVMAEIPGITPKVARFARRVRDIGCTVIMPDLFGVAGRDPDPAAHGRTGTVVTGLRAVADICVSREFTVLAAGRTSPVVGWLRALAAREHERCGGPGVGAVGMCFTGGYALAMATDERLLAPVLCQPSLPLAVSARNRRSLDISPADLHTVQRRCEAGLTVLGLRFRGDRLVPAERFALLRARLGDAFIGIELDDGAANPHALTPPHSTVTEHLVDEPGQPTREALDRVLDHLRARLLTSDT